MNRLYLYIFAVTFLFLTSVPAATLTVSKDGTATYNTIQAAVSAASAGDNIEILDQSIYEEQVTFDSTKKNLTLQAKTGVKPVICYQDTIHIHPVNATEATALNIDFDRNGVIRIIKAANITIANIIIRGKIATTFGDDAVWGTSPFQFGNTGISILSSSNIVIRNCDISNTFIGIYFKDYSTTGLFTSEVPDKDEKKIFCGFGKTGNHLFERNRIHNNSWGIFCESAYDLGSSIRYNLFYENHHYSDAFAETVNKLTSDGFEQTGGAICLKDNRLSPLAIYNNTFWHNFALIGGHWQAGAQQLIFNNIYAEPNQYWVTSANTGFTISTVEMSSRFKSRMFNCVYAAQEQAPQENEVKIMFGLSSFASSPVSPGQIINTPFTADENIRWLETKFKSTDTASPDFLVPDWNDANVQQYILDKGWSGAGILDADGTIADLGALPKGGLPTETIRIMPFAPVSVTSTSAKLGFSLSSDCTLDNPRIKYLKFVTATPESSAVWNQTVCTESASTASLKTGCNILSCAISKTIAKEHYGFFEMVVEGTANSKTVTSAIGLIPFHHYKNWFDVAAYDKSGSLLLTTTKAGDTVQIRIKALDSDDQALKKNISPLIVTLGDGTPITPITGELKYDSNTDSLTFESIWPVAGSGTLACIAVSGIALSTDLVDEIFIYGTSGGITVSPNGASVRPLIHTAGSSTIKSEMFSVYSLDGRLVYKGTAASTAVFIRQTNAHRFGATLYFLQSSDRNGTKEGAMKLMNVNQIRQVLR